MKRTLFLAIVLMFCSSATSQTRNSSGTNIRGLIQTTSATDTNKVPLGSASVVLYSQDSKSGKWAMVSRTTTNEYGYYFFYGVAPGKYFVQVNGKKNYEITVVPIDRKAFRFQELPFVEY